ncbi:hypothetical protein Tco_0379175 [Tanacetum coccineum]
MVPRTVLTRSDPISLNAARPVNTVQPRTAVNNARGTHEKMVILVNDKNVNAARPMLVGNPQQALKDNRKLMEDLLPLEVTPQAGKLWEDLKGRKPALSFMRPFGCPVTILNTIDHLGKFDGKADEGFFVGYSTNSKAFRFNGFTDAGFKPSGEEEKKDAEDPGNEDSEVTSTMSQVVLTPPWRIREAGVNKTWISSQHNGVYIE